MKTLTKSIVFLGALTIAFLVTEAFAQVYARYFAMQGKLFEPDSSVGWRLQSNLDITRRNSDGEIWRITTNGNGIRGNSRWDSSKRKVLIVGDSFAMGDGVNVEDRFDVPIQEKGLSVITLGVIGYGTDQELITARPFYEDLNSGDIFIIMTCYNDFWDIARQSHSGRSKIWYELIDGNLIRHDPVITWPIILRDKSYLWAKASSLFEKQTFSAEQIVDAFKIYDRLVSKDAQELQKKGVHVFLAYFGFGNIPHRILATELEQNINSLCEKSNITCVPIDARLSGQGDCFLKDGHWNKKGNNMVGNILLDEIEKTK